MQGDEINRSQSALVGRQQIEPELATLYEIQGQLLGYTTYRLLFSNTKLFVRWK